MIQTVARVSKALTMDPITILSDGGDPFLIDVRIACAMVIAADEKKQADEQNKGMRRGGAGRRPGRRGR